MLHNMSRVFRVCPTNRPTFLGSFRIMAIQGTTMAHGRTQSPDGRIPMFPEGQTSWQGILWFPNVCRSKCLPFVFVLLDFRASHVCFKSNGFVPWCFCFNKNNKVKPNAKREQRERERRNKKNINASVCFFSKTHASHATHTHNRQRRRKKQRRLRWSPFPKAPRAPMRRSRTPGPGDG